MTSPSANPKKGTLYIVSTPIGNREDITLRALRILKEADLIAAEDTRHTGLLLRHFGIQTPLTSYFEGNESKKKEFILSRLSRVTHRLVSDAERRHFDPGFGRSKPPLKTRFHCSTPSLCHRCPQRLGLPTDAFLLKAFLKQREGTCYN
jgi:16S rRNA (cytidine1402-2'-O)-methyltransferase